MKEKKRAIHVFINQWDHFAVLTNGVSVFNSEYIMTIIAAF